MGDFLGEGCVIFILQEFASLKQICGYGKEWSG